MTNSVTFPTNLGGDGSTVTDDDNASTGLGNGGHRTRFVPAMGQVVAVANTLTQRLAATSDTSSSSVAIASGTKSFTTAKFYEWVVGMYVLAASTASPTNLMYGQVTAYNSSTGALDVNVLAVGGSGTYSDWTISLSGPPNLSTLPAIISVNSSSDALRITQTGAGNALVVEDSANPDSTPFVVDASGNVVAGNTAPISFAAFTPNVQSQMASQNAGFAAGNWQNTAGAANIWLGKSRGGVGTHTVVQSGDGLGNLRFYGSDGTGFIEAASIYSYVDGTPGTNDMPGRLVFSTTADGASTPTEALRINNNKSSKFSGAAYFANVALTDASTIAWDTNAAQVATFTFVSSNRTMGAPTNLVNGAFYALAVIQNAGSNTLTWNSVFKWASGAAPTLSTAAGAKDYFTFRSDGTNLYEQGRSQAVN
jgi:hypothetical protein